MATMYMRGGGGACAFAKVFNVPWQPGPPDWMSGPFPALVYSLVSHVYFFQYPWPHSLWNDDSSRPRAACTLKFKDINDLPLRIQRFSLGCCRFNFTLSHVTGKLLAIVDTSSVNTPTEMDKEWTEFRSWLFHTCYPSLPTCLQEKNAHSKGTTHAEKYGWPEKRRLPNDVMPCILPSSIRTVRGGGLALILNDLPPNSCE